MRVCSEEGLEFAQEEGIRMITADEIEEEGPEEALEALRPLLELEGPLHVSLDLDVLDPAFAPAVQTPEPLGLSPRQVLKILSGLCGPDLRSFDIVELTPGYDHGQTAILAARLAVEVLCRARPGG